MDLQDIPKYLQITMFTARKATLAITFAKTANLRDLRVRTVAFSFLRSLIMKNRFTAVESQNNQKGKLKKH
jgi:hypothetical protein